MWDSNLRRQSSRNACPMRYLNRWITCEVREKTNKMQQLDVYYQHFLNMFRA